MQSRSKLLEFFIQFASSPLSSLLEKFSYFCILKMVMLHICPLLNVGVYNQGMDDNVVPPSMTDFARRMIPGATLHRLLGEGHLSYFCFCDDCHRQIFSALFGTPQGPLMIEPEVDQSLTEEYIDEEETTLHNSTEQE